MSWLFSFSLTITIFSLIMLLQYIKYDDDYSKRIVRQTVIVSIISLIMSIIIGIICFV